MRRCIMKRNFLPWIIITVVILTASAIFFVFSQVESQREGTGDIKAVEKIREYHMKGDLETAIKEANLYLTSNPNNIEVLIRLAECYASKGNFSLAEETAKKAVTVSENTDAWALRLLATIYRTQFEISKDDNLKKKYLDSAQIQIEKAININSKDPWVNAEASQIYFAQNNKAKAIQAIELALKLEPNNKQIQDIRKKIQSMP